MTKRGQLAIGVRECTLLAKALLDPPDLFHGISDPELRYRQRELDLMANEDSREIFKKRDEADLRDPQPHERARLGRAGNAGPAAADRRRRGAALRHPPQRARPRPLPAHRDRALPEAGDRRRLRGRLRVRQVLPQRGDVAPAQPRVHDAGDVRRRRRLQRRHGVHRGPGLERRRAGDGDDEGDARRGRDRLRGALAAGASCATSSCARPGSTSTRRAATSWPSWPATTAAETTTGPAWSTPCRASWSSRS